MKINKYINPKAILVSFKEANTDIKHYLKYKSILSEIQEEGKLEKLKIKRENDMLYIGVNLNPELLMYADQSLESAELKFVADSMRKYTDFLQKEGILDVIKADYERVHNDEFYGYVVQIAFDFQKYTKTKYRYDIGYLIITGSATVLAIFAAISYFL
jgi:hypothetical protein